MNELLRELLCGPVRAKRYISTQEEIDTNRRENAAQRARDERAQAEAHKRREVSQGKLKMNIVVDDRWHLSAEVRNGLLHLSVVAPEGELFCAESVHAHLGSQKVQLMIGAFDSTNHQCALPDVQSHDGAIS